MLENSFCSEISLEKISYYRCSHNGSRTLMYEMSTNPDPKNTIVVFVKFGIYIGLYYNIFENGRPRNYENTHKTALILKWYGIKKTWYKRCSAFVPRTLIWNAMTIDRRKPKAQVKTKTSLCSVIGNKFFHRFCFYL